MGLHIETCTLDQLGELTEIARKTFVDAFEAHNNPRDFTHYLNSVLTREHLERELKNPNSYFYFVKSNDSLVGYFKLNKGDAQTELKGDDSLELERIYVGEKYQGMHIGKWILEQVKIIALNRNRSFLWLGVWEHNTAAIRFYERHGFRKFGRHPYYIGNDKQMDWLMRLDLVTFSS